MLFGNSEILLTKEGAYDCLSTKFGQVTLGSRNIWTMGWTYDSLSWDIPGMAKLGGHTWILRHGGGI